MLTVAVGLHEDARVGCASKLHWLSRFRLDGCSPLSSMNSLGNSHSYFACRANTLHDDLPASVARMATADISIKSCFAALLLREYPTPWKRPRNFSVACLQTLLFVVDLANEWHHATKMKNRKFKGEGPGWWKQSY